MIRFSAFLVVVAVGLLVAGVVTSKLLLVYIAIGVSGVALLALGVGAAVNWRELTGKPKTAAVEVSAQGPAPALQVPALQGVPAPQAEAGLQGHHRPAPAQAAAGAAPAGSGWPVAPSGPPRAGYLPTDQPLRAQPATAQPSGSRPPGAQRTAAAFTARPEAPGPGVWEWRDDSVPASEPPPAAQAATRLASREPALAPSPPRPPQPAEKPVPPRVEAAEPWPAVVRKPPQETPVSAADQPPVKDQAPVKDQPTPPGEQEKDQSSVQGQPPAGRQDDAKPAASAIEPEPGPVAGATSLVGTAGAEATASTQPEQAEQPERAKETELAASDLDLEVTVVPGVPRYHNARCMLIRFMGEDDLEKMTRAAAREIGCTPCRACLPDQPEKSPE